MLLLSEVTKRSIIMIIMTIMTVINNDHSVDVDDLKLLKC